MMFLLLIVMLLSAKSSADVHEYMLALKECLLADLKPADGTSDVTALCEGYDETLHSLMQTFWDMFNSGQICKPLHSQNAPALLRRKHHSANF
jgi:hypothetical protein